MDRRKKNAKEKKEQKLSGSMKKKFDKAIKILEEYKVNMDEIGQSDIDIALREAGIKVWEDTPNITKTNIIEAFWDYIDEQRIIVDKDDEREDNYNDMNTDTVPDSVRQYMRDISVFPLLTREEEEKLFKEYYAAEDDITKENIRNKIMISNLRLVVKIAMGYEGRGLDLIDLISNGNLGLIKAIERFDLGRECKLSTYALFWIKQSINKALVNTGTLIREPDHVVDKRKKINACRNKYLLEYGREPSVSEMSVETGLSELVIRRYWDSTKIISLDNTLNDNEKVTVGDIIPDTEQEERRELERDSTKKREAIEHFIVNKNDLESGDITLLCLLNGEIHDVKLDGSVLKKEFGISEEKIFALKKMIDNGEIDFDALDRGRIDLRENVVLTLIHGFVNGRYFTKEEVAELLNLTIERVIQIYSSALSKLRGKITEENILRQYK